MHRLAIYFAVLLTGLAAHEAWAQGAPGPSKPPVSPEYTAPIVPPNVAADYVHPHELIDIGRGRKKNIFCMGKGSHTVIFDSGLSDWSSIWASVQPGVATHARACVYDRAGMGYSDPSDQPRSPVAIAEDLHKLILAAKIDAPVVLVGHSLGGFNMKLYAAIYPNDVAGLVLVDPTEERSLARVRNALRRKYGNGVVAQRELDGLTGRSQAVSHYDDCAAAARIHDLDPASKLYKDCTDPVHPSLGPKIAAERQKIQVKRTYQDAQASELANSVVGDPRSDDTYAMLFSGHALGDKPLIVLTHSIYNPNDSQDAMGYFAWNEEHKQTAALSARGVNRVVPETDHYIELDRPQAVIDAISQVLGEISVN